MSDSQRIQPGRYVGRATGAFDLGYSSSGNAQIMVEFELLNEGYEGTKIAFFGSFASAQSTEITMRQLRDAGWSCDDVSVLSGLGSNDVELQVKYETYDGKERMKVAIWPIGGGVPKFDKPLGERERVDLAKRLKGAAMQSRSGGQQTKAQGWAPPQAGARPQAAPVANGAQRAPQTAQRADARQQGRGAPAPAHAGQWDGQGADPGQVDQYGVHLNDDMPF